MKNICVVGSGTAGLVSAAIISKCFPEYNVKVIASESIGIIGVGEGSTEHWRMFETLVGIEREDLFRDVDATFKFGIRFIDWTKAVPDYFHSIAGGQQTHFTMYSLYNSVLAKGKQLTPHFTHPGLPDGFVADLDENPMLQANQLHFDTHKLNIFLKRFCVNSGVDFIDDKIADIVIDEQGEITHLIGTASKYDVDFVIDCSGFRREILSRVSDQKWISFSDYLPCDTALVLPTDHVDDQLLGYTIAESMPAGWRWEIPTQSRKGNGYVFGSSYIEPDEAVRQMEDKLGVKIKDPRFIDFSPGTVCEPWSSNCVAIGLSSNFVEPLEATSISSSILQAALLTSYLPFYENGRGWARAKYNSEYDRMIENLLSMICLHYVSDRDDTDMWRDQKSRPKPAFLDYVLDIIKHRPLEPVDIPVNGYELFSSNHFLFVAAGQGLINPEACEKNLRTRGILDIANRIVEDIGIEVRSSVLLPQRDLIMKGIKNGQPA